MVKVLTIAGSDSSGGAGIQADLKTMTAHCVYGMSVITALTAQNTTGVYGILNVPESFVREEIDAVFSDITPDAVKVGMVSETEIIKAIADKMIEYSPNRTKLWRLCSRVYCPLPILSLRIFTKRKLLRVYALRVSPTPKKRLSVCAIWV